MKVSLKQEQQLSKEHFHLKHSEQTGVVRSQPIENLGVCYSDQIVLAPDLTLVHLHYSPVCSLTINQGDNPHNNHVLVITLGLHGHSYYQSAEASPTIDFNAGYTTINAFRHSAGQRYYHAAATTSQLRLIIGKNLLQQYVGHERANLLLGDGQLTQLRHEKTSPTTLSHASVLARHMNHHETGANRLALHMHSLGLLSEQLELLLPPDIIGKQKLSPDEIRQLEQVQDLMQKNIAESITEESLCIAIGISKSKLKEGFRYLFNSTPHKMLLEMRMRKAHLLLESGYQVAQTAWNVGYRHPNNFSVAFNQFFGYSPKSVLHKK